MSGHTPGPWSYRPREHDDWGIVRGGPNNEWGHQRIICQAKDPSGMGDGFLSKHRAAGTDPWEANARLIAAAPALLEALEEAANTFELMVLALREIDAERLAQPIAVAELLAKGARAAIAAATDAGS